MKIKLSLKEFSRCLQVAMRAINVRPAIPILSYILIDARSDKIVLSAYEREMGLAIRVSFPGDIIKKGAVAVKGRTLSDIVSNIPEDVDSLELEFNDIQRVRLSAGKSEIVLVGKPESEFPKLPEVSDEEESFNLSISRFLVDLKRTTFACSTEMPKNFTSGVLLSLKDNSLQVVATDGRRLAISSDKLKSDRKESDKGVLIPAKTMLELSRILGMGWEGDLELHLSETLAMFKIGNGTSIDIITHLLDTSYPDYERVVPESTDGVFTVNRERFLSSLKQVGILAKQQDGRDTAVLEIKEGKLIISSKAESEGKADVELPIKNEGGELKIAFNYQYLIDPLMNIDNEDVNMLYSGPLDASVITLPGDESFTYVIMPVRLPE